MHRLALWWHWGSVQYGTLFSIYINWLQKFCLCIIYVLIKHYCEWCALNAPGGAVVLHDICFVVASQCPRCTDGLCLHGSHKSHGNAASHSACCHRVYCPGRYAYVCTWIISAYNHLQMVFLSVVFVSRCKSCWVCEDQCCFSIHT